VDFKQTFFKKITPLFPQLLLARNLTLVTALCEAVKQDEHDDLCHALLPIFEEHQQSLHLLKWGIKAQIYETCT